VAVQGSLHIFISTERCCSKDKKLVNRAVRFDVSSSAASRISGGTPFGMPDIFCGCTHSLIENAGLIPLFGSLKLPSVPSYSLFRVIQSFDAA
jgi:hypothetical protein